ITKISYEVDQLNNEYFRQVSKDDDVQKSRWYKMVPCICSTCVKTDNKHFYKYDDLLKRKAFGKNTVECEREPYQTINITQLLDGVFTTRSDDKSKSDTVKIFISYSSK